jgi:uncharacterized membrane protein YraQ (UPF0718 family)
MKTIKRYRATLILLAVWAVLWVVRADWGWEITVKTGSNFYEMLSVLPPIFILLGLLEIWVPREVIIKNLGDDSGFRGIFLSILLGAAAAGPLYIAFPVAVTMLKKGARFGNIVTFLFAWSTLKIPLLLFEATALGWRITLVRAAINLPAIIIMGYLVDRLIPQKEKDELREKQLQADATTTSAS